MQGYNRLFMKQPKKVAPKVVTVTTERKVTEVGIINTKSEVVDENLVVEKPKRKYTKKKSAPKQDEDGDA